MSNPSTLGFNRLARGFLGVGLLATFIMLVSGCAARRQYRDLKDAYSKKQYTDYYYEEVSRVDGILPQPDDTFLKEVDAKVSKNLKQWQAALETKTPGSTDVVDIDPELAKKVAALSSEELQEMARKQLDLPTAIAVAVTRNPQIKAAEANLKAALERFPQAVNLDIILSQYNAFTRELNTAIGPTNHKSMVRMSTPTPGVIELRGDIVDQDVMIALKKLEITKRDVVAELKKSFFEYVFLEAALSINGETQQLLEELIKVAQVKYKSDNAKYGNVVQAQLELAKISNSLITLKQKESTAIARLNMLMNLPSATEIGPAVSPDLKRLAVPAETIQKTVLASRQEIQIKAAALKRIELMVSMAGKMTYPDLTAGNSYYEEAAKPASARKPGDSFMTNRTINQRAAGDLGRRDAYISEMRAKTDSMERQLSEQINQSEYATRKAVFELDSTLRSLKLHREVLIPQANQALKATKTGYTAGKLDFIAYLDAQRTLLQMQLGEAEAVKDYQTILAMLDQLAGTVFDREPFTSQPQKP